MAGPRVPIHLGGPLGVAGVGLILGAAALAVSSVRGKATEQAEPANSGSVERSEAVVAAQSLPPVQMSDATEPSATAAPDLPRPFGTAPPDDPAANLGVTPQQAGTDPMPARGEATEVIFIMRLKGEPEIDTITQNFKRDRTAAEDAYARLLERTPALADFDLVGASYSGEIRLAYQMPPGETATRDAIESVKERLLQIEGVAYVDPDYVAHPGKDSPK